MTDAEPTAGNDPGSPDNDYRSLLRWAYEGEVFGAVLLNDLLTRRCFPRQDAALRRLLRLESDTRDALRPLVDATDVEVDEGIPRRSGLEFAAATAQQTWSSFCETTEQIATDALPTFRRLLEAGPAEASAVLRRVVAHEECLLHFARHAQAGRDDAALAVLDDHLNTEPLPRPR